MSNHSTTFKYRADIDGLRAIAVLSVVGFHAFPKLFRGGFIGVDIFFVISGFLISAILFDSLEKDRFSFSEFYGKRIKRIFPALLTVLIFCIVFGWLVLFPEEYKQLGKHIAGGAGFISNYLLWNEVGYFDNASETKPLLHLWSLGIEEQFYIIWPILLWAGWKSRINSIMLIAVIAILSFVLSLKDVDSHAVAVFYSPQTRFWELLCGSFIAWVALYKSTLLQDLSSKLNHFFSLLGFVLVTYGIYGLTKFDFPGAWALVPTFGAMLIITAGSKAWINRVVLSNRIIIWFGLISFPLYLWHWPLLSFARIIEDGKPNKIIRIAAIIISIFLAWLTYRFIEKPVRFGKGSSSLKTVFLVLFMSFIGYMGLSIYGHQGFESRFKNLNELNALITLISKPYPLINNFDCRAAIPELKNFDFDGGCRLSKETAPEILFLGDSHTHQYFNAIFKSFPTKTVMMVVQTSCLPFASSNFLQGECREKYKAILSFLESNTTIKKVYLSGHWAYLMSGGFGKTGDNWRNAKAIDAKGAQSFTENGRHFLAAILKTNKEVIFLKDIPDLDFNIKSCFKIRPFQLSSLHRKECWLDYAKYRKRNADYDKVIAELLAGFPKVKIYNPRPLFCKNNKCIVQDNLLPYYFNGDHLNHHGADFVFKDLLTS
ncbi:MAG: acyltransferase [Tatlockia sp.]|nr:acyltransferase [Tatlockia sp.]